MNNNKQAIEIARITFDWINTYLPKLKTNSLHTIKSYKSAVNLYITYLETINTTKQSFNLDCFNVEHINRWLIWLKTERKCGNKTCNNRLAAVKSLLKYFGIRNPVYRFLYLDADLSIPKLREPRDKVQGMSKEAVKTILSIPDTSSRIGLRDLAIMSFEYGTATRIDEVLSLKIESINLNINKPYATVIGKGDKIRTAYLMAGLVEILRKYIRIFHGSSPKPGDYLFYSSWHKSKAKLSQEAIRLRLKKYALIAHELCNEVPLDLHSHLWRHSKAQHWLEDGLNIVEISKLLGHANLETTMVYQGITSEQQRKALATLEDESNGEIQKNWNLEKLGDLKDIFVFTGAE